MATELTQAQQQAIASARARRRREEAEQKKEPKGFLPFLNKGIATTAGAPVDLVNAGLGAIGLPVSDQPFGGSQSIRAGMGKLGIGTPDRAPQGAMENIGQVSGEVAASMIPFGAATRAMSGGKGVMGGMARAANNEMVNAPVRTGAIEAGGAVGAGTARGVAENNEMGPGGRLLTEVVGGALGGVGGAGALSASKLSPARAGLSWAKRKVFPFTEAGALERASKRVQEVAVDPERAARMIDDLKGSNLLPSARTDEPGLMALERAVLDADVKKSEGIARKTSEEMEKLVNSIRHSGSVSDTRAFIEAKRARLLNAIDARIENAAEEATMKLGAVTPSGTPADYSVAVRESLEKALADAKVQEGALWQAVPQNAQVPVANTRAAYQRMEQSLPMAQKEDMPPVIRSIAPTLANPRLKAVRLSEMDGLYKKLGEVGRKARAAGDFNQARISDEVRDAILEDMGQATGGKEVSEAVKQARAFSLELNKKFRRGPVGKILGYDRKGGDSLPESLALDRTVGRKKEVGKLAADDILAATNNDPNTLEAIQSYLKAEFVANATQDGRVVPGRAQTFIRSNAELLEAFPDLKAQITAAQSAEDVARRVSKSGDGWRRSLQRKSVSRAAQFLNATVNDEVDAIMKSNDPEKVMRDLVRMAKRDRSGEAVNGLKAGASEWLIRQATEPGADATGRAVVNGARLAFLLKDKNTASALSSLYSPEEFKKVTKSADLLRRYTVQAKSRAGNTKIIGDAPAFLIDKIGQVVGAKMGAKVSSGAGASIQSASIGSKTVRDFLRKLNADKAEQLLVDAVEDPELMKVLLTHEVTGPKRNREHHERVLRAWLAGRGSRLLDDEEE